MQWVAKPFLRSLAALLIFLALSVTLVVVQSQSNKSEVLPIRYCFDTSLLGVRVTNQDHCPMKLLDLGLAVLVPISNHDGSVDRLNPYLRNRFTAISAIARENKISLRITSGYRTYLEQERLFQREVKLKGSETAAAHWVLPPKLSRHTQGLALDLASVEAEAGMKWLAANSWRAGLCRIYLNERWHFEAIVAPGESCPNLRSKPAVTSR